jgi:MFS family permease
MSAHPQYPQQPGYPQTGYPQPGYPQQGYPQPGYPQAKNPFSDQAPNPYAAPQAGGYYPQPAPQKPSAFAGLWRQGNILVMHKMAPLPDICLLSNQPANRRLTRNLSWHHPAIALTILAGVLVYVILAMILTKRATILLPLTEEWYARRRRRMLFAWGVGLVCLGMMIGGFVIAVQLDQPGYVLLSLVGLVGGLIALIAGQALVGLVSPKRMTDEYIWLKGVHPDFLNRLDVWPYNI